LTAGAGGGAPQWQQTMVLMVVMQASMAGAFSASAPFMPFFLVQLGVHPVSQVAIWAGLISGVQALTVALTSPFWGALADHVGRKAMVQRCCAATVFFYFLIALCREPWQIFAVQAISGLFGGFAAAAMTLVGTQAPEGRLGYALGWMMTGQLIGNLTGPLLGGIFVDTVHDVRLVFYVTSIGALAAGFLTTAFVREDFQRPAATRQPPMPLRAQFGEIAHHPTLLPLLFVLALGQIIVFAANPVIPIYVREIVGNVPWLGTAAGSAIAIVGVAGIVASPFLGRLGDRIGYRNVLLITLLGAAVFTFPQALTTSFWLFLTLRFGVGLFTGGIMPAANALVGSVFPRERRGRIYGITSSASYLGLATGPALGGLVGASFGVPAVFVMVGIATLLNLGCVLMIGMRRGTASHA
jgi:DHA1 family multidrug resistance protein-like MFS transporter